MSNAVKYSPPKTVISIEAAKSESEIQIIVRDNGFGIPKESLERIFEKFYRLEHDATSKTTGTGLVSRSSKKSRKNTAGA